MLRKILLILLLIFGIIQFFHPDKNTDNSETADSNDISRMMTVPAQCAGDITKKLLRLPQQ